MRVIVVGDPHAGAVAACSALPVVGALAWPDSAALRSVAGELAGLGWEALVVDPEDLSFSTSSMSLLSQMHGPSAAVIVHLDDPIQADLTVETAVMVLRHLKPVPVVLTGLDREELLVRWNEPREALELGPPNVVDQDTLADVWAQMPATTGQEA
jgi:hypothetical protein